MDLSKYFYLTGILVFLPFWLLVFSKQDKRKDMLFTGVLLGVAATITGQLFANMDYWHPIYLIPRFPFEDFLYGFIFGGLSAELYELVFHIRNSKRKLYPTHKIYVAIFALIIVTSFLILVRIFSLNSIIAYLISTLLIGIIIAIVRRDLLINELLSGVLVTILTTFMFYILLLINPNLFETHWLMNNLSGYKIGPIPLEEFLFAFSVGFSLGGLYEMVFGYSEVKTRKFKQKFN